MRPVNAGSWTFASLNVAGTVRSWPSRLSALTPGSENLASVPIVGTRSDDPTLISVAAPTALAQFFFVALSFGALTACYVTSDFSVYNVYENSNSAMPLLYRFTSVWGNHEGSMMLWIFILALFGALVAAFGSNLPVKLKANALAVQAWIAAAFELFILTTSNPFLRIADAPFEGRDLNPILQDPGLAFHPPLLYLGYSASRFPSPSRSRLCWKAASMPLGRVGCGHGCSPPGCA